METAIQTREEIRISKLTPLEELLRESGLKKEEKLIAVRRGQNDSIVKKEKAKVWKRIFRVVSLIKSYAREELLIDRELTPDEILALRPMVMREARNDLLCFVASSIIYVSSILGGFLVSPIALLGIFLNSVFALKYDRKYDCTVSDFILVSFFWLFFNPAFLLFGLAYQNINPRLLKMLDLDDKPEEYKSLVAECINKSNSN